MTEQQEREIESPEERRTKPDDELSIKRVPLGQRKLGFYFNLIKFPIIIAVILEIVYFLSQKNFDLDWIIKLLALSYVALVLIKKHQGKFQELAIACGMTGLLIGFFNALFKAIYIRKFYLIFNLISEPVITALVGIFVGLTIGYIFLNILTKYKTIKTKDSLKKGGD